MPETAPPTLTVELALAPPSDPHAAIALLLSALEVLTRVHESTAGEVRVPSTMRGQILIGAMSVADTFGASASTDPSMAETQRQLGAALVKGALHHVTAGLQLLAGAAGIEVEARAEIDPAASRAADRLITSMEG